MNEAPHIRSVDEACTLVARWFGWEGDLAGSRLAVPPEAPSAIQTLNRRLGRLWTVPHDARLFDSQDRLVSPYEYKPDSDGTVCVIVENQGVWSCGFKPETGDRLWAAGDWPDARRGSPDWRLTPDPIDVAVIFVLLSNAVWASEDCEIDEDDKPATADRLLWSFSALEGFSGFWTNDDMTIMRMQGAGWGVTARR